MTETPPHHYFETTMTKPIETPLRRCFEMATT
jgi:hypothetical protein